MNFLKRCRCYLLCYIVDREGRRGFRRSDPVSDWMIYIILHDIYVHVQRVRPRESCCQTIVLYNRVYAVPDGRYSVVREECRMCMYLSVSLSHL